MEQSFFHQVQDVFETFVIDVRRELGGEPTAGVFIGADRWRRISEIWDEPHADDVGAAFEIAARLADYVSVLEPLRRA